MKRTVWITGGSRGIGAATVRAFAEAGWQVGFGYLHAEEEARRLESELRLRGCSVLAVQGDIADRAAVEACAAEIRVQLGAIDALVCNAGIAQQKMFCDLTEDDWDGMFGANVKSAFHCIQTVLPDMVHRKAGSIVTVSSVWGVTGASCESHYAASKAALIGLSKSLAQELGLSGIRVNCIAPGVIDTDMNRTHGADTMHALTTDTPLGRIGKPEEVAQTILFLCEQRASFITGQVLGVTGGFMI